MEGGGVEGLVVKEEEVQDNEDVFPPVFSQSFSKKVQHLRRKQLCKPDLEWASFGIAASLYSRDGGAAAVEVVAAAQQQSNLPKPAGRSCSPWACHRKKKDWTRK